VISSFRRNGDLHVTVADDGPGLPSDWQAKNHKGNNEGIGLANTSERLKHLYGSAHRFDLRNGDNGGMTASIAIPFRAADGLQG
jgi:sensor histidine kinase YesM